MNLQEVYVEAASELFPPSSSNHFPIVIERGEGPYLYDMSGKQYIDFATGIAIATLGHCHPRIAKAVNAQCTKLMSSMNLFPNKTKIELAQKILGILPKSLDAMFFSNSGTEAIEGALKLARKANPGRPNFLAFNGGFHGRTFGAMSITGSKSSYRKDFFPLLPNTYFVDYPYKTSLDDVILQMESLFEHNCPPTSIAAIIAEPILGEGGYVTPPEGFLKILREVCDKWGILLILDEVQTGFGRTGKWFACEHYGLTPDIITFAKGIASGLPLGGFAASKELMSNLNAGSHGTTFGGNPISCAAAIATIQIIESEGILERVQILGNKIIERLREKFNSHLDIRGKGFMIGIEPKEHFNINLKNVLKRFQNKGLLINTCGKDSRVLRIVPPLNVPESVLNEGLSILEQVLDYEILVADETKRYQMMS